MARTVTIVLSNPAPTDVDTLDLKPALEAVIAKWESIDEALRQIASFAYDPCGMCARHRTCFKCEMKASCALISGDVVNPINAVRMRAGLIANEARSKWIGWTD